MNVQNVQAVPVVQNVQRISNAVERFERLELREYGPSPFSRGFKPGHSSSMLGERDDTTLVPQPPLSQRASMQSATDTRACGLPLPPRAMTA